VAQRSTARSSANWVATSIAANATAETTMTVPQHLEEVDQPGRDRHAQRAARRAPRM
jgi:hypothetical protein